MQRVISGGSDCLGSSPPEAYNEFAVKQRANPSAGQFNCHVAGKAEHKWRKVMQPQLPPARHDLLEVLQITSPLTPQQQHMPKPCALRQGFRTSAIIVLRSLPVKLASLKLVVGKFLNVFTNGLVAKFWQNRQPRSTGIG